MCWFFGYKQFNHLAKSFGVISVLTKANGALAFMHGSILPVTIPPPPGNPRDKSSPSGPAVGNCLKRFCPGGRGAGQIENNFSFFL